MSKFIFPSTPIAPITYKTTLSSLSNTPLRGSAIISLSGTNDPMPTGANSANIAFNEADLLVAKIDNYLFLNQLQAVVEPLKRLIELRPSHAGYLELLASTFTTTELNSRQPHKYIRSYRALLHLYL